MAIESHVVYGKIRERIATVSGITLRDTLHLESDRPWGGDVDVVARAQSIDVIERYHSDADVRVRMTLVVEAAAPVAVAGQAEAHIGAMTKLEAITVALCDRDWNDDALTWGSDSITAQPSDTHAEFESLANGEWLVWRGSYDITYTMPLGAS